MSKSGPPSTASAHFIWARIKFEQCRDDLHAHCDTIPSISDKNEARTWAEEFGKIMRELSSHAGDAHIEVRSDTNIPTFIASAQRRIVSFITPEWIDLAPDLVDGFQGILKKIPPGKSFGEEFSQIAATIPPPSSATRSASFSPSTSPAPHFVSLPPSHSESPRPADRRLSRSESRPEPPSRSKGIIPPLASRHTRSHKASLHLSTTALASMPSQPLTSTAAASVLPSPSATSTKQSVTPKSIPLPASTKQFDNTDSLPPTVSMKLSAPTKSLPSTPGKGKWRACLRCQQKKKRCTPSSVNRMSCTMCIMGRTSCVPAQGRPSRRRNQSVKQLEPVNAAATSASPSNASLAVLYDLCSNGKYPKVLPPVPIMGVDNCSLPVLLCWNNEAADADLACTAAIAKVKAAFLRYETACGNYLELLGDHYDKHSTPMAKNHVRFSEGTKEDDDNDDVACGLDSDSGDGNEMIEGDDCDDCEGMDML